MTTQVVTDEDFRNIQAAHAASQMGRPVDRDAVKKDMPSIEEHFQKRFGQVWKQEFKISNYGTTDIMVAREMFIAGLLATNSRWDHTELLEFIRAGR